MYYPEQRPIAEMIRIRRRTMLPEYVPGQVMAKPGSIVDVRETVARGTVPSEHLIIDAAHELHAGADDVEELLLVEINEPVEKGDVIAGKDPERGRRVYAPMDGMIVYVDHGRIIFKAKPEIIDLQAGVRGQVVMVVPGRGVGIEATGAVIQGVWGNDRHVIAPIRFEPDEGMENILIDDINPQYRGDILITKSPLTAQKIRVGLGQQMAGIIAPGMDARLEETALKSELPIMLITGFGGDRIHRNTMRILEENEGYQAVMDAAYPHRFDDRRAELMINKLVKEDVPPANSVPLEEGMTVRITRDPYEGRTGEVVEIPHGKVRLANGLRVEGVYIEVGVDEIVAVPLANIELAGT